MIRRSSTKLINYFQDILVGIGYVRSYSRHRFYSLIRSKHATPWSDVSNWRHRYDHHKGMIGSNIVYPHHATSLQSNFTECSHTMEQRHEETPRSVATPKHCIEYAVFCEADDWHEVQSDPWECVQTRNSLWFHDGKSKKVPVPWSSINLFFWKKNLVVCCGVA